MDFRAPMADAHAAGVASQQAQREADMQKQIEFSHERWLQIQDLTIQLADARAELERLKQYVPKHAKSTATFDELWLEAAEAEEQLAKLSAVVEKQRKALQVISVMRTSKGVQSIVRAALEEKPADE